MADGLAMWKVQHITERLHEEYPDFATQVQDRGDEERQMCADILRGGTPFGRVAASTSET